MAAKIYNVLFLCTGNSTRSIFAESLLNHWGYGKFRAFSAGSFPTGRVNPKALELLEQLRLPTAELRSKSWSEFSSAGSPALDLIITVCDRAAGESCPVWPGQPVTAHWAIPDPATTQGSDLERALAFRQAFRSLERRIRTLVALPVESLDRLKLRRELDAIHRTANDTGTDRSEKI